MKFIVTKKFMIAKIEPKGTVNLYTLLDSETFEKFVSIGTQDTKNIQERDIVEAEIAIRTSPERFVLKTGEVKFVEVANTFIVALNAVNGNA